MDGTRERQWPFKHAPVNGQVSEAELLAAQSRLAVGGVGANQNSQEAGVFISQAALDGLANKPHRRLLGSSEGELVPSSTRITISPLQLQSYVLRLIGVESEEARLALIEAAKKTEIEEPEQTITQPQRPVELPISHLSDPPVSYPIISHSVETIPSPRMPPPPPSDAILPDLNAIPNPAVHTLDSAPSLYSVTFSSRLDIMPQGGHKSPGAAAAHDHHSGGGDHDANHQISGPDSHELAPVRPHEAWTVIPTRMEYLVVLLASFGALLFFMQMLKVLDCGATIPMIRRYWGSGREWMALVTSVDTSGDGNTNASSPNGSSNGSGVGMNGVATKARNGSRGSGPNSSPLHPLSSAASSVAIQVANPYDPSLYEDENEYESGMESDDNEGNADD